MWSFKAFALTGRQVCVHDYPGRCPGLRASALSGRAGACGGVQWRAGRTWAYRAYRGVYRGVYSGVYSGVQSVLLLFFFGLYLCFILWSAIFNCATRY